MPENGKARLDPRVPIEIRVDVEYPPKSGVWGRSSTYDLSASGVYIRCGHDLPLKAQVLCRLYLPPSAGERDRLIDAQAVVVRVDAPIPGHQEWRYGLYFLDLADTDLDAIRRFVFASL